MNKICSPFTLFNVKKSCFIIDGSSGSISKATQFFINFEKEPEPAEGFIILS